MLTFFDSENNPMCKADLKVYISLQLQFWFVKKVTQVQEEYGYKEQIVEKDPGELSGK